MGDQEDRHAELVAQTQEKIQDLRLNGDVERGGWLVGDQEARPAGERHGDHDPLAQAARELMRILLETTLGRPDPDQAQQVENMGAGLGAARPAMQTECLADLEADRKGRVERGHRLLEDHADPVAAYVPHRPLVERQEVRALEPDAPALDLSRRRRQEAHDRPRRDALAAARLADQTDDPAYLNRERQIVDHTREALLGAKADREILDREQRRHDGAPERTVKCASQSNGVTVVRRGRAGDARASAAASRWHAEADRGARRPSPPAARIPRVAWTIRRKS